MKPIKLKLSGFKSYIQEQIIDFDELTKQGLFGIFGDIGSGKSSILEAIILAMYGDVSKDINEYINISLDAVNIVYEFEICKGNSTRKYIVERNISRDVSNVTSIKYSKLTEIYNESQSKIIANTETDVNNKIIDIVGLTIDDFKKSVIIPQGKFNEFIKLTRLERRNMLERVFNLEKYGTELIEKLNKRKEENNKLLLILKSKLDEYDEISEEKYNEIEKELEKINEEEKYYNKKLEDLEYRYKQYKDIYEIQLSIEKYSIRKKEIDLKSKELNLKTKKLEDAFKAEKINPYIENINILEKSISKDKTSLENIEKKLNIDKQELIIVQNQYEDIKCKKDLELPKLREEKLNLERSLEHKSYIDILDSEIFELNNKNKKLILEKESLQKNIGELESKKIIIDRNLNELEAKAKSLKINAEQKYKILLAYDIEKKYEILHKERSIKIENKKRVNTDISLVELKYKILQKNKENINKNLEILLRDRDSLLNQYVGDIDTIIKQNEVVSKLKYKSEMLKEYTLKRDIIKNEISNIDEQKFKIDRDINSLIIKIERESKEIKILEKELERLKYLNLTNELRKQLKDNIPCPVCKATNHNRPDINKISDQVDYVDSILEKHIIEEKLLKIKIEEYNIKNSELKYAKEIKKQELNEVNNKIDNNDLIKILKKYEEERKNLELLKISISTWEKDKEILDNKIAKTKEDKYEIDKEYIVISEYIKSNENILDYIEQDLVGIELKYSHTKNEYLNLKSILRINDIKSKVEEINKNEYILEEIDFKLKEKQNDKNKNNIDIDIIQKNLYEKQLEISKIYDLINSKKNVRDEKNKELSKISKGKPIHTILGQIDLDIKQIISEEKLLDNKKYDKLKIVQNYLANKNNIEGRLKSTQEQYKEQLSILNRLLTENKFESIYNVKKSLLDEDCIKELKNEISSYEEEEKRLKIKIYELKSKIGDKYINNQVYDETILNLQDIKTLVRDIESKKSKKQFELMHLKESLIKIYDIKTQLHKVEHKLDLIEELNDIIKENKFVEYVSINKLKHIAINASIILKNITNERYSIEVDKTLDFVIKDNFNNGKIRNIQTLSGGEMFLVSLALAFSLSAQIQLNGNSKIEFFIIDEGFGYLDKDTIESVVNALQILSNKDLRVGIITHIDEFKNKVPIKLIVKNNNLDTGSKVNIEYS